VRLPGYCTSCRRVRRVTVTRPAPGRSVQSGICDDCQRADDDKRQRMRLGSFTCPRCGRTSHHPQDVAEGYCGHCHDWTAR
jgi:hypothetical protein